ncbi:unnamed protein product [Closterium sp. NIES-53]
MAAQELCWLTYLLTDLGVKPRSPPVLYVDKKAMIALCQEHRLEHRTKHIALPYFLARELQQRGQLRLAYVATRANIADVFTKVLPPEPLDPHRFDKPVCFSFFFFFFFFFFLFFLFFFFFLVNVCFLHFFFLCFHSLGPYFLTSPCSPDFSPIFCFKYNPSSSARVE